MISADSSRRRMRVAADIPPAIDPQRRLFALAGLIALVLIIFMLPAGKDDTTAPSTGGSSRIDRRMIRTLKAQAG